MTCKKSTAIVAIAVLLFRMTGALLRDRFDLVGGDGAGFVAP